MMGLRPCQAGPQKGGGGLSCAACSKTLTRCGLVVWFGASSRPRLGGKIYLSRGRIWVGRSELYLKSTSNLGAL